MGTARTTGAVTDRVTGVVTAAGSTPDGGAAAAPASPWVDASVLAGSVTSNSPAKAGAAVAMIPSLSRLRVLRQWAGIMDMTMDGSPFIAKTPVEGLYFNGGWCYGGFKATPGSGWCFAHTIAQDEPHPINADLTIDRFRDGRLIDERGSGPNPWAQ